MVLAANRDEFYNRPTGPLAFWDDAPDILAGRDLKHKGTWLGITRTGRIAAITNFREPFVQIANAPSRGFLVSDFLSSKESPENYLEYVKSMGQKYNGFNILVGDMSGIYYYSNRGDNIQRIKPGFYGLSNHLLDTPWPKVEKGNSDLGRLLADKGKIDPEDIFGILKDGSFPADSMLPDTGVGYSWERILSSIFITSSFYGTHSSSIILMERSGKITFMERSFISDGAVSLEPKTRKFSLKISD
jgi:uncharacterized protein with NRDE domain